MKKEKQKRQRKQQKNPNILLLQSRSPKRGSPFPSLFIILIFSKIFSIVYLFERAFEATKKNNKDCKQTLKKYSFRNPRREISISEHVGLICISNT